MREQTLKKAVFTRFIIIIFVTAILSSLISSVFLGFKEEEQVRELVEQNCKLAAYQYKQNPSAKALSNILEGDRVTIIAPDGNVIDDSSVAPETMENHKDRYEVGNAQRDKVATESRRSETLEEPFMYGAIVLDDGNILRLAHGYTGVLNNIVGHLPAAGISFVFVALLSLLITGRFIKNIVTPLDELVSRISTEEYHAISEEQGYYEINKITERIQSLLESLQRARSEIEEQNKKREFILSSMSEGVVFLDENCNVTLMNRSAEAVFGVNHNIIGSSFHTFTQEEMVVEAIEKALK